MKKKPEVIQGVTEAWAETGTEGMRWSVYDESKSGYDGLYPLENGDHLTIYSEDGSVLFANTIKQNPAYGFDGVTALLGSWTQDGWDRREWAMLFYRKHRAKLVRGS